MAGLAYFQFYPADWLSDPDVRALTLEERGAYFDILCRLWLARGRTGRLPDDPRLLADFLGVRIDVWRDRLRKRLGSEGQGVLRFEDGEVFNDRQQLALAGLRKNLAEMSGKQRLNTPETGAVSVPDPKETAVLHAEEARSQKLEARQKMAAREKPRPPTNGVLAELAWPESVAWVREILSKRAVSHPRMLEPSTWVRTEKLVDSWGDPFTTRFANQLEAVLAEFLDYEDNRLQKRKRLDTAWLNNVKRWHDRELGKVRREQAWGKRA